MNLLLFRRQVLLLTQEGLTGRIELGKPLRDHLLFATFQVCNPDFLKLIYSLLRHSLVEVLLLRAQMATQATIDRSQHSAVLVHLLVRGGSLAENSVLAVVAVAYIR